MASTTTTADPVAATPAGAAEAFMPLTITHLVLIALAIAATIAMIWWGRRLKQRRDEGEDALEDRGGVARIDSGEPIEDQPEPTRAPARPAPTATTPPPAPPPARPAPSPAPEAAAIEPAPVAPSPPPLADAQLPGTPPLMPAPMPVATSEPAPAPAPVPTPAPALVPAPAAAPAPAPTLAIDAADLTTLKGLGPKVAGQLNALGIVTISDLADLSPDRAQAIDAQLGPFTGRMARDRWIEQARLLHAGDRAGYEAKFGKLGG